MARKSVQRFLRDKCSFVRSKSFWIIILIFFIIFSWQNQLFLYKIDYYPTKFEQSYCKTFDIVYTWVNGSDPVFIETLKKYQPNYDPSRFDDKNELKYSLRSIEKYASWIRHIYIVTNGQIPHWLDLTNDKITIIPHSDIVTDPKILPIFSSSSIETFLHRIPNLSKYFLYLNDDIFLGEQLYPEDLYTNSDGVKIYTAWSLPDCLPDCPWAYIGDGACDEHCNHEECQYDGGDCKYDDDELIIYSSTDKNYVPAAIFYDIPKEQGKKTNQTIQKRLQKHLFQTKRSRFFKDFLKLHNTSEKTDTELQILIDTFNKEQIKLKSQQINDNNYESQRNISSKDIYAQSLINTNKLFNRIYGFKTRKVLAHVGFLLDRDIINDMNRKFPKEIDQTRQNRFRNSIDLQFAFTYYNFLMSETINLTISEIFDQFDTDGSLTWSDREIRTLLTRIYQLPLDWAVVRYFEDVIRNCSSIINGNLDDQIQYTTLVYERYEDSNIPTVSKRLVMNCKPLIDVLKTNFEQKSKYKFHINQKTGIYSNFKMLTSNITEVITSLDELRRNPKKFNCINDNLEIQFPEDNQLIKYLLDDFYLSFFPKKSQYELSENYRNRFTNITEYELWKNEKKLILFIFYIFSAIFLIIFLKYCCFYKGKYASKIIPLKCCDI